MGGESDPARPPPAAPPPPGGNATPSRPRRSDEGGSRRGSAAGGAVRGLASAVQGSASVLWRAPGALGASLGGAVAGAVSRRRRVGFESFDSAASDWCDRGADSVTPSRGGSRGASPERPPRGPSRAGSSRLSRGPNAGNPSPDGKGEWGGPLRSRPGPQEGEWSRSSPSRHAATGPGSGVPPTVGRPPLPPRLSLRHDGGGAGTAPDEGWGGGEGGSRNMASSALSDRTGDGAESTLFVRPTGVADGDGNDSSEAESAAETVVSRSRMPSGGSSLWSAMPWGERNAAVGADTGGRWGSPAKRSLDGRDVAGGGRPPAELLAPLGVGGARAGMGVAAVSSPDEASPRAAGGGCLCCGGDRRREPRSRAAADASDRGKRKNGGDVSSGDGSPPLAVEPVDVGRSRRVSGIFAEGAAADRDAPPTTTPSARRLSRAHSFRESVASFVRAVTSPRDPPPLPAPLLALLRSTSGNERGPRAPTCSGGVVLAPRVMPGTAVPQWISVGGTSHQPLVANGAKQLLGLTLYDFGIYAGARDVHRSALAGRAREEAWTFEHGAPLPEEPWSTRVLDEGDFAMTVCLGVARGLKAKMVEGLYRGIFTRRTVKAGGAPDDPALEKICRVFSEEALLRFPGVLSGNPGARSVAAGTVLSFSRDAARTSLRVCVNGDLLDEIDSPVVTKAFFDIFVGTQPTTSQSQQEAWRALGRMMTTDPDDAASFPGAGHSPRASLVRKGAVTLPDVPELLKALSHPGARALLKPRPREGDGPAAVG